MLKEVSAECVEILDNETEAYQIISAFEGNIPKGWCNEEGKHQLLVEYKKKGHNDGWPNWNYPRLRSILACEACVRAWKINYDNNGADGVWGDREKWGYIAGNAWPEIYGTGGSCSITFVKNGWSKFGSAFANMDTCTKVSVAREVTGNPILSKKV